MPGSLTASVADLAEVLGALAGLALPGRAWDEGTLIRLGHAFEQTSAG